jgi:hypothetical protein
VLRCAFSSTRTAMSALFYSQSRDLWGLGLGELQACRADMHAGDRIQEWQQVAHPDCKL